MWVLLIPVLFLAFFTLGAFSIIKAVINDQKSRNYVNNTDTFSHHYCFVLPCDQAFALRQLAIPNVNDHLRCDLSEDGSTLTLSHLNASLDYRLAFYVVGEQTCLKVSCVDRFHGRTSIPFRVNRFFMEKLGAVPVDYNQFHEIVTP